MIKSMSPFSTALFIVLVGISVALHIWKLPPALPVLQTELALDLVDSGFLLSSVQVAGVLLGLVIGLFAERIGLRRCILIGLAILAFASMATTLFSSKAMILLCRGLEGCGFLMVVLPIPALFKRLVPPQEISRIMGFWGCYMPVGAVIIMPTGAWLLSISSWRTLWVILAVISMLMFWLALLIIPSDKKLAAKLGTTTQPSISMVQMVKVTFSSSRVWMTGLTFGVYAAQWAAVIGFLPTIYAMANISGPKAGVLTALVAGSNVIGNLIAGRLLHRGVSARRLLVIGFIIMITCAFIAFGTGQGLVVQFFAIVIFSALGGLLPATLFFLAVTFAPTPQTTASTVGWVQQCSSLGQFLGPPVVAWVVSSLGGWQWTWVATGAFALLGILMTLPLVPIQKQIKSEA